MITVHRICERCGRAFKQAWTPDATMEAVCQHCKDQAHAH